MTLTRKLPQVILAAIILGSFIFLLSASQAAGGYAKTFYDLDVVAVNGQNGLTSLFAGPSINDRGNVSFVGRTGGSSVFHKHGTRFVYRFESRRHGQSIRWKLPDHEH